MVVPEKALRSKYVLKNTDSSTKWALWNFLGWKHSCNTLFEDELEKKVPESLFSSTDPKILSKWLMLYAAETRKRDGTQYSAKSIYLLLGFFTICVLSTPPVPIFWTQVTFHFLIFTLLLIIYFVLYG